MSKICPYCNTENEDLSEICEHCGNKFDPPRRQNKSNGYKFLSVVGYWYYWTYDNFNDFWNTSLSVHLIYIVKRTRIYNSPIIFLHFNI
jgi:hypothetical protein